MEQYIRIAWLQELYFGKVIIPLPTTEEIGTFIDRKQQKITLDGFSASKRVGRIRMYAFAYQSANNFKPYNKPLKCIYYEKEINKQQF